MAGVFVPAALYMDFITSDYLCQVNQKITDGFFAAFLSV
jgi:hypothetical protein